MKQGGSTQLAPGGQGMSSEGDPGMEEGSRRVRGAGGHKGRRWGRERDR